MGFRVSYRLSLIVAIPALVVGTGVLIGARTFFTTRAVVGDLTRDLFDKVSQQTADKTRSHLALAIPVVELLGQLHHAGTIGTTDDQLTNALVPVLRAHPSFSWVSFADETGRFIGASRRPDGSLRVNRSHIVDGKTVRDEDDLLPDGKRQLRRHDPDTGYDPRQRPFYKAAKESGARAWTDPYVFFDSGVPGISCALPVRDPEGRFVGVFSVDFDLNGLSEFVASIDLSPSSRVFVFTPDGKLLAHPTVRAVAKEGARAAGELTTLEQSDDPQARALIGGLDLKAFAARAQQKAISFRQGGRTYLGSLTSFAIEPGSKLHWVIGAYALQSDFQGGIERSILSALGLSLLAVAGAVILGMLLAGQVSQPLLRLAQDMEKVGRFEVDEKPDQNEPTVFEEIHVMSTALAKMKGGLRSFASYVPRDLVRTLVESGNEAKLGGEIRHLTVFFSDLAGFTTLSESMKPDELVRQLGAYFEEMTQTIAQGGGTVDKFIGDGIMAFWGAPIADPAHAERALLAAIRCQQQLEALAKTEGGRWLAGIPTRIGIATGEVLVGNIGTPTRMNYTVMGDTANLAARLESLGKQYGVSLLAEENAVQTGGERILARPVDVVAVKGRARGAKVYELLGLRDEVDAKLIKLVDYCRKALDAYLERRFADAAIEWNRALGVFPNDPVASIMRDRAVAFQKSPPPADWDGVYVAKAK